MRLAQLKIKEKSSNLLIKLRQRNITKLWILVKIQYKYHLWFMVSQTSKRLKQLNMNLSNSLRSEKIASLKFIHSLIRSVLIKCKKVDTIIRKMRRSKL